MKKTNFFKLLTLSALSLSVFASCNYVKEADFQDLCKKVDAHELSITELKAQFAAMDYVKSVVPGPGAGEWTVTPNEGTTVVISTLTEAQVKAWISEQSGDTEPTGILSVNSDNEWCIDGEPIGVKANEFMPKIIPATAEKPAYWAFPTIVDGKAVWTAIPDAKIAPATEGATKEELADLIADLEALNDALAAAETDAAALAARVKALEDNYGIDMTDLDARLDALEAVKPTYATHNATTDQWTLYVPNNEGGPLTPIELPSRNGLAYASVAKIDILGWVDNYVPTEGLASNPEADASTRTQYEGKTDLDPAHAGLWNTPEKTFAVYYSWIEDFHTDTNKASMPAIPFVVEPAGWVSSVYGGYLTGTANDDHLIAGLPANRKYTYPNIYTPGAHKPSTYNWTEYGIKDVYRYDLNTTLDTDNKGLVIQVHPLTANIGDMDFILQDSKGNIMPIQFKKPVKIEGLMTRVSGTASNSALWFIEGKNETEMANTSTSRVDFATKFTDDTVWSLVTADGLRSEYTPFTFTPSYLRSRENQVKTVMDGTRALDLNNDYVVVPHPVTTLTPDNAWQIRLGSDVSVNFYDVKIRKPDGTAYTNDYAQVLDEASEVAPFESAEPSMNGWDENGYTSNEVVDWYWMVGSNTHGDDFIRNSWGLEFSADHRTFKATKVPDKTSEVGFWMDVYKLGIDGTIYLERVPFVVIQDIPKSEVTVPYTIYDQWPAYHNDYMSVATQSISLQNMFTKLGGVSVGSLELDPSIETMEDRWKDNDHGAYYYTFSNLNIEGLTGNQIGRFMFPNIVTLSKAATNSGTVGAATGTTGIVTEPNTVYTNAAPLAASPNGAPSYTGQATNNFGATAMGIEWLDDKDNVVTNLYDAHAVRFTPNYAYNNGTDNDASFVLGSKHTFTVDFYNYDKEYLSSFDIIIVPEIPAVDNRFKKDPRRWNGDVNTPATQTELQAYYHTPWEMTPTIPWAEHKFYGKDYFDAASQYELYQFHDTGTLKPEIIGSVAKHEAGGGVTGWHVAETSTYYNVFNPGGSNDMRHTNQHPLDGGYLLVGNREDYTERTWVDGASVALRTEGVPTYGNLVRFPKSAPVNQFNETHYNSRGFTSNTIVQLLGQTKPYPAGAENNLALQVPDYVGIPFTTKNENPAAANAYDQSLPLYWNLGRYIHYYEYDRAYEEATYPFDMKIMSALEKGKLNKGEALVVNQGTQDLQITDAHIWANDYVEAQNRRSIFKVYGDGSITGGYFEYNYIAKVVFYRPDDVSVYDLQDDQGQQNNNPREAKAPTATVESYLPIRTNNTYQGGDIKLGVKVYDRFGRTLEDPNFTFNITQHQ